MIYDAQRHRKAIEAEAATHLAREVPGSSSSSRNRVLRGFMQVYPREAIMMNLTADENAEFIMSQPKFRCEVGSIWLWLFAELAKALLVALIQLWWQTRNSEGQL